MSYIDFPYQIDARGRSAETDYADYIRDLIEQVLFTMPGERVNRPDFGCGLAQLVFTPNSEAMANTTQALTQSALQQWLGELIQIEAVQVISRDASLHITVQYLIIQNQERQRQTFTREIAL